GHQRLLLTNPGDCFVGHVSHEVIALVRGLVGLDRNGPLVKRGVPLICFTADEPIEIFESATAGGPCIERTGRTRLPYRHLVTLTELGCGIAVQLQEFRERRAGVRAHRVVSRRRRGDLGDATHADSVMIATREKCGARRRAQRSGMETVVSQSCFGKTLCRWRLTRAAECAGRAEARVVD